MNIPFRGIFDRRVTFHVPAVVSICTDLKPNIFTVVLSGVGWIKVEERLGFLLTNDQRDVTSSSRTIPWLSTFMTRRKKFEFVSRRSLTLYNRDEAAFKAWFTKSSDELALKYDICSAWI